MSHITRELAEKLTKAATDDGKILELGWIAYLLHVMPKDAPQIQVQEMRKAFFCGATHLFDSVMTILDPGAEPTERDLERMDKIYRELQAFQKQVTSFHNAPERKQ